MVRRSTGVELRSDDLVRIAQGMLRGVPEISAVLVARQRRSLRVFATTEADIGETWEVARLVETRLRSTLMALRTSPRVVIVLDHAPPADESGRCAS